MRPTEKKGAIQANKVKVNLGTPSLKTKTFARKTYQLLSANPVTVIHWLPQKYPVHRDTT